MRAMLVATGLATLTTVLALGAPPVPVGAQLGNPTGPGQAVPLEHGDEIIVGKTFLRFLIEGV